MKMLLLSALLLAEAATLAAAARISPDQINHQAAPKGRLSNPDGARPPVPDGQKNEVSKSAPAAPVATPPATAPAASKPSSMLDAYVAALTAAVPLTKDQQTDIKTYYLDDGAHLQAILNDPSLSPLQQTRQVDALRDARNAKIAALLGEPTANGHFLKVEADYRVALIEAATDGALLPATPPPRVPEPTNTTPAQADAGAPRA